MNSHKKMLALVALTATCAVQAESERGREAERVFSPIIVPAAAASDVVTLDTQHNTRRAVNSMSRDPERNANPRTERLRSHHHEDHDHWFRRKHSDNETSRTTQRKKMKKQRNNDTQ